MHDTGFIALNEDDSHYFSTRAGQDLNAEKVDSWVDQYADTQIKMLFLNPNCMSTSFASSVWNPIWEGYDPLAGDDQPFFAGLKDSPEAIAGCRNWVHTAWQLNESGIDVYERWITRCRKRGISPRISMRMNDIHNVDNELHPIHSKFWRNNPQLRRINHRFHTWTDRAFDYGRPEVREYHMKLVRELADRYDFDGFELDWMRSGFHFQPGSEAEGIPILTEFTADVRRLLDDQERIRGHKISLSARVAAKPETALGLGMDAVTWARLGLIDMLVVTPHFGCLDTDMPIDLWKQLLDGTDVTLGAGFELHISPSRQSAISLWPVYKKNTLETLRGAASSALDRGADCVYLFNYMDSETAMDSQLEAAQVFREIGSLDTLEGKSRRHIITYEDTVAPGEPRSVALPMLCRASEWQDFRVHIGPKPASGNVAVVLGIDSGVVEADTITVCVNGKPTEYSGAIDLPAPRPNSVAYSFSVPLSAMSRGYNVVDLTSTSDIEIGWIELMICPIS